MSGETRKVLESQKNKKTRAYVVGLTGGIACGKTTAAQALRALGAEVIDADAISRALTAPGGAAASAVIARFGTLDRKVLGGIVFSDEKARGDLNAIVHPLVIREVRRALDHAAAKVCVIDVPLLYESGMEGMADEVWVAHVPRDEQLRRVMARDGLSEADARLRIESQMPVEEKLRRADSALDTSGAKEETRARIEALYAAALRKADARP